MTKNVFILASTLNIIFFLPGVDSKLKIIFSVDFEVTASLYSSVTNEKSDASLTVIPLQMPCFVLKRFFALF